MGRVVIACYRPKAEQQQALRELLRDHVPTLRSIGLVTDRIPVTLEAKDGTVIEIFEWASPDAIQVAHTHPIVAAMWEEFARVCDFVPVGQVPEASQLFADFTPVDVAR